MLALLLLAAAAHAIPAPSVVIPVFELADLQTRGSLENVVHLKTPCINDCHHYVLDHPFYIVAQHEKDSQFLVHFIPQGLNGLGRNVGTASFNEKLLSSGQPMVTLLAPLSQFPFELFPKLLDQDIIIPEYHTKLIDLYKAKDTPVLAIIPEADFKSISNQKAFVQVADLLLQNNIYQVGKEQALAHHLAPAPPAIIPTPVQETSPHFILYPPADQHQFKLQYIPQVPQYVQYPLVHPQTIA